LAPHPQELDRDGGAWRPAAERRLEGPRRGGRVAAADVAHEPEQDETGDEEQPDRERARGRDRPQREQDDERDDREEDRAGRRAPCHHVSTGSLARSSSRTATSASIASSLIDGSGSWWLNLAHSKRSVSLRTSVALASRPRSARSTYSSGASAGFRGIPAAARAFSIRAYAATIARRRSGSARRSSSDSSSAAARTSGGGLWSRPEPAPRRERDALAAITVASRSTATITSSFHWNCTCLSLGVPKTEGVPGFDGVVRVWEWCNEL